MSELPRQVQVDIGTLILRIIQIDREETPGHWLWSDRVMECDVPRLSAWITDLEVRDEFESLGSENPSGGNDV